MMRPESIEEAIRTYSSLAATNLGSIAGGHYNYVGMKTEIARRMRDLVSVVEVAYGKDRATECPTQS